MYSRLPQMYQSNISTHLTSGHDDNTNSRIWCFLLSMIIGASSFLLFIYFNPTNLLLIRVHICNSGRQTYIPLLNTTQQTEFNADSAQYILFSLFGLFFFDFHLIVVCDDAVGSVRLSI